MDAVFQLPPQQLSYKSKTASWRKKHLDWADNNSNLHHSLIRNTTRQKKINYDLVDGILDMEDMESILNPDKIKAKYIPKSIQHYPIMNSKLNVLRGEESKRIFDYRVVVTNANAISEMEEQKKAEVLQMLQYLIESQDVSEEEFKQEIEKLNQQFQYTWQDSREIWCNEILNHYSKELDFPVIFNAGFMDAMIVGEEIYQCSIVGGEPILERLNPLKVKAFRSGFSNKIEDADIVTIEDYWSPAKIIDTFYDVLTPKDRKYIEEYTGSEEQDSDADNMFIRMYNDGLLEETDIHSGAYPTSYTDTLGNIRVLRMYWKSRRKVKKITSIDPNTGEETVDLYPETYVANEALGEREEVFYINEAWEGTKIGQEIYVNMRPCPVQYTRLSNPSKCHFGIIGTIYNTNEGKPFSMVDMMKNYNYMYNLVHDRLNKLLHKNWGKIITLDLAKVPEGWDVDKWLYYAKVAGISVVNSFKEGNYGAATGKLAGGLNNNTSGVIDAEMGNSIQANIMLLEFIKNEMSEVIGISKQREGQISNRETVGGVERATLQSSHITEWIFSIHDNVKKRVLECFIETAKIAVKGDTKKFNYILSDAARKTLEIDGDIFYEADYGLIVDNSNGTLELNQKLDSLAQAALQNQLLTFSSLMQLYSSPSMAEKQHIVRKAEEEIQKRREQEAQQQQQQLQQQLQAQEAQAKAQQDFQDKINQRDNDTRLKIATLHTQATITAFDGDDERGYKESEAKVAIASEKVKEDARQFDAQLKLEEKKLEMEERLRELEIKAQSSNKK